MPLLPSIKFETSTLPVQVGFAELAQTFGFASASHFTTAFRRAFGCTPRELRRGHRDAADHEFVQPDGLECYVEWQDHIRQR